MQKPSAHPESSPRKRGLGRRLAAGLGLAALLLLAYGFIVEPLMLRVVPVVIKDEPFAHFFSTHRVFLISDIHVSWPGFQQRHLLKKLASLSPDYIFLAGDVVSWRGDYERAYRFLSDLATEATIIGVVGDSDTSNSRKSCRLCHAFNEGEKPLGVHFLRFGSERLTSGRDGLQAYGVEMDRLNERDVTQMITFVNERIHSPAILLSHRQPNLEELPDKKLLILSGDTHGGQTLLMEPLWQAIFGRSKGPVRRGVARSGSRTLVVSSGVGLNSVPIRFLCPPEIIWLKGE